MNKVREELILECLKVLINSASQTINPDYQEDLTNRLRREIKRGKK